MEHLGTERRESKAPPGGRSAVGGKGGDGLPPQAASRAQDRGELTVSLIIQYSEEKGLNRNKYSLARVIF